jgi:hypothetical protein
LHYKLGVLLQPVPALFFTSKKALVANPGANKPWPHLQGRLVVAECRTRLSSAQARLGAQVCQHVTVT